MQIFKYLNLCKYSIKTFGLILLLRFCLLLLASIENIKGINIECVQNYVTIIKDIVSIALLLWGVFTIKKMKDKKIDATTDFYAKLRVHLTLLKNHLGTEQFSVLSCLYNDQIIDQFITNKPKDKDIDYFLCLINDLFVFLKNTNNQVIPSKKFFDDIYEIIDKLTGYSQIPNYHPFTEYNDNTPLIEELKTINKLIDGIIQEISKEQINLYKPIWKGSGK